MKQLIITKIIITVVLAVAIIAMLSSCSRSITVQQAANGKAKCGRWLK